MYIQTLNFREGPLYEPSNSAEMDFKNILALSLWEAALRPEFSRSNLTEAYQIGSTNARTRRETILIASFNFK